MSETVLTAEMELQLCEDYKNLSIIAISKKYHISTKRIYEILKVHNIPVFQQGPRQKTFLTEEQELEICQKYSSGRTTIGELCAEYHIAQNRLSQIFDAHRIKKHVPGKKKHLLSTDVEAELCKEYKNTSLAVLLKKYNISLSRLYKILEANNVAPKKSKR